MATRRPQAFTLVEILIVVVLLAVLATIVVPSIAKHAMSARKSALKANLALLRQFIPVYQGQHREVLPGYPNGDTTAAPTEQAFRDQALLASDASGRTAPRGTPGFKYGPYLSKIPASPLNGLDTVQVLAVGQAFPETGDDSHGWIYQPETGMIRADSPNVDEAGIGFYAY